MIDRSKIPSRVRGTAPTISSYEYFSTPVTLGWSIYGEPLVPGKYDVVLDCISNGIYDEGFDALLSDILVEGVPPKRLSVKLTGEFDYLKFENVRIRLAALVTDADTGEPVSDVDVTLDIYDLVTASMVEKVAGSGIYEWESDQTIHMLMRRGILKKGVYVVHVRASLHGGPIASDILEFHIDPPAEDFMPTTTLVVAIIALLASIVTPLILFKQHIKRLYTREYRSIHTGFAGQ